MSTTTLASVAAIAQGLVEKCRKQDFEGAIQAYYSPDIVSIESQEMPGLPREMKGLEAVLGKCRWWEANHQIHQMDVSDPLVSDSEFAVLFAMDVTNKPSGQRMQMKEIAVYDVENGKITREQFFYGKGC